MVVLEAVVYMIKVVGEKLISFKRWSFSHTQKSEEGWEQLVLKNVQVGLPARNKFLYKNNGLQQSIINRINIAKIQ